MKRATTILVAVIALFCITAFATTQQKWHVSGSITYEDGEPVIGATVREKGTTSGAVTDIDGKFSLMVKPYATLVFSFIGMTDYEYKVKHDGEVINIVLKENAPSLEEIPDSLRTKE